MTGFRIAHSRHGTAPRVYHDSDSTLAVALILPEDDGTVTLFPVRFSATPYPLTGASMSFDSEEDVRAFLGIAEEEMAA